MTHHSTTKNSNPSLGRCEPTAARRQSAELRSHPKRMEGLTRRLAHCLEELWGVQRDAIIALDDAISRLGTQDRCSQKSVAVILLAELEVALDKVSIRDHDTLPRPESLFAITDHPNQEVGQFFGELRSVVSPVAEY